MRVVACKQALHFGSVGAARIGFQLLSSCYLISGERSKPRNHARPKPQIREGFFALLALASRFDCRSRVTSRDRPKRRACLQAISVGSYYIKKIP